MARGESGPLAAIFSLAFSMTERLSMALKLSSAIGITAAEAAEVDDNVGEVGEISTLCREGVLEREPRG